MRQVWAGKKPQNVVHYTIRLIGLKEKLGVSRTIDHNESLRLGYIVEPGAYAGQAWSRVVCIIARNNYQQRSLDAICRAIPITGEEDQSIDLAGLRCDRCIRRSSATETPANDCDRFGTMVPKITDGCQYVQLHRRGKHI
jgi:hypothetical protein